MNKLLYKIIYPKKIRIKLLELSEFNQFDERAFDNFNKYAYKIIFIWWSFSAIFLIVATTIERDLSLKLFLLALCVIFLVLPSLHFITLHRKFSCIFLNGKISDGKVDGYYKHEGGGGGPKWGLEYSYIVSGKIHNKKIRILPINFWSKEYRNGEEIKVYYLEKAPNKSAPDVGKLSQFLNFKKISRIKT